MSGWSVHVHVDRAANLRARTVVLEPGGATHAYALVSYASCAVGAARAYETRARASDEGGHVVWQEALACSVELQAAAASRRAWPAGDAHALLDLPLRLRVHAAPARAAAPDDGASGTTATEGAQGTWLARPLCASRRLLEEGASSRRPLCEPRRPWDDGAPSYVSRAVRQFELVGECWLMLDRRALGVPCWIGLLTPRAGLERAAHAGALAHARVAPRDACVAAATAGKGEHTRDALPAHAHVDGRELRGELLVRAWLVPTSPPAPLRPAGIVTAPHGAPAAPPRLSHPRAKPVVGMPGVADGASSCASGTSSCADTRAAPRDGHGGADSAAGVQTTSKRRGTASGSAADGARAFAKDGARDGGARRDAAAVAAAAVNGCDAHVWDGGGSCVRDGGGSCVRDGGGSCLRSSAASGLSTNDSTPASAWDGGAEGANGARSSTAEAERYDAYGFPRSGFSSAAPPPHATPRGHGATWPPSAGRALGMQPAVRTGALDALDYEHARATAHRLHLRWERQSAAWFDTLTSVPRAPADAVLPTGVAPAKSVAGVAPRGRGAQEEWARLVAVGIPLELRQRVWADFSGASELRARADACARLCARAGTYAQLVARLGEVGSEHVQQIEIDLPRTFPEHRAFGHADAHAPLRRVLCAFALRDPARGYTQSLNFVAAFALLFSDEESAFWLLCAIAERLLPCHYTHGMLGVQLDNALFDALARAQPRLAGAVARLDALDAELALVSTPWFMGLFTTALPAECALRVWDLAFFHGADALMAVALAILSARADALQRCTQLEAAYAALKDLDDIGADVDAFIALVVSHLRAIRAHGGAPLAKLRAAHLRSVRLQHRRLELARLAHDLAREHGAPVGALLRTVDALPDDAFGGLALGDGDGDCDGDGDRDGALISHTWVALASRLLSPCWRDGRLARRLCEALAQRAHAQPRLLDALRAALAPAPDERLRLVFRAYASARAVSAHTCAAAAPAANAVVNAPASGTGRDARVLCERDVASLVADAAALVCTAPRGDKTAGATDAAESAEHERTGGAYAQLALGIADGSDAARRGGESVELTALDFDGFARFVQRQPHLLELLLA
ncbi:hypothetical protein KFE25_000056 [Diacronema lutheri]|uniref:Rab-GAP TBC domain-containing protein n=1 Tax=Diacronema lutheri TaxID=2081491 RepID=A0A8J5XGW9_DIALT|nr:hypothetical protein KFE25_000056 [Diacronema lutheri]